MIKLIILHVLYIIIYINTVNTDFPSIIGSRKKRSTDFNFSKLKKFKMHFKLAYITKLFGLVY